MEYIMQQLGLALTPKEEQLAIHMTLFSVGFTYEESNEWYEIYILLKYGREGASIEKDV
tara:strand:- start:69 stop:245 length:177 start_codon:yes stop_codon:yes gene_type:complete